MKTSSSKLAFKASSGINIQPTPLFQLQPDLNPKAVKILNNNIDKDFFLNNTAND